MSTSARLPRQSFIGTGSSTPSRPGSSQSLLPQPSGSGSGIPTPSSSRRKSSLGPSTPTHTAGNGGGSPHYVEDDEEHASRALAEAMRVRPPSSVGSSSGAGYGGGSVYGTGNANGSFGRAAGRTLATGLGREDGSLSTPPPLGHRQHSTDSTSSAYSTPTYPSALRQSALRNPLASNPGATTPKTPVGAQAAARARIASTALGRSTLGNGLGAGQGTPTTPSSKRTVSAYAPGGGPGGARRVSTAGLGNSTMRPPAMPRTPTSGSIGQGLTGNGSKTPPARSPAPPQTSNSAASGSVNASQRARPPWDPEVGDDVRIPSMGFEGVLRYKGPVRGKGDDAIFAGVELFEGFKGRGRNNGEVGDDRYFETTDLRGLFIPIFKLARATVNPSRTPSVASSHRSTTSSAANGNGRATPAVSTRSGASGRETPYISAMEVGEDGTGEDPSRTPSKAGVRSVVQGSAAGWTAKVPPVPASAASGTGANGAGTTTRAAAIAGLSSAQLAARKAMAQSEATMAASQAGPPSGDRLRESTTSTTTTPKAARLPRRSEVGSSLTPGPSTFNTPSRSVSVSASAHRSVSRQSIGGVGVPRTSFSTPKAPGSRSGRTSIASGRMSVASNHEMMPPAISPTKYGLPNGRHVPFSAAKAEEVERINATLLEKIRDLEIQLDLSLGGMTLVERDKAKKETDQRMRELSIASDFASREASTVRIELEEVRAARAEAEKHLTDTSSRLDEVTSKLNNAESSLAKSERDLKIQRERAEEELEKGMEIKRKEIRAAEERLKDMESQLHQAQLHVSELTEAGQMSIAILEKKVSDSQSKRFELETNLRRVEDKLTETEARARQLELPPSPSTAARRADTAATIDNENLKAQVAHQKDKINGLEDQLEELRSEKENLESTSAAAVAKSREAEKRTREDLSKTRVEVDGLKAQATRTKSQMSELEYAIKESKMTLAHTQVEIETMRGENSSLQNLRGAQTELTKVEKQRGQLVEELAQTKESLDARQAELDKLTRAFADLRSKHEMHLPLSDSPASRNRDSTDSIGSRRPRMSNGMTDAEKSLRGFQHIIQELTSENAALRQKTADLEMELESLRAELASAINTGGDAQALADTQARLERSQRKLTAAYEELKAAEDEAMVREENFAMEMMEMEELVRLKMATEEDLRDEITQMERDLASVKPSWKRPDEREAVLRGGSHTAQQEAVPSGSSSGNIAISNKSDGTSSGPHSARLADCMLCGADHDMEDCKIWKGQAEDSPAAVKVAPPAAAVDPPASMYSPKDVAISPAEAKSTSVAASSLGQEEEAPETWCYNCSTSLHDDEHCTAPPEDDADEVF